MKVNAPAVASHRAVNALIADGHVKIPVHREPEIGGHMIVPIQRPGIGIQAFDQIDSTTPNAVVVCKHAELRGVNDVEFPFQILHAEHRVEFFRKHRDTPIRMKAENASFRRVRLGQTDVHRVFGDEHAAIRRACNHGRMIDFRSFGDELDAPIRNRLR